MQTDCTGHTIPPPAVLCPDGTVQTNCAGHMTQPVQPHLPIWLPLDFTQATSIIQAGKTYRASFTGSVGGPEMTALQALLQQAGMTVTTTGPADWPDAADAADPSRVKIEAAAFASGAPPLALVPTLKMWVKT